MSLRAADAHRPRTRNGFVLFWVGLFVLSVLMQYAGAMSPQSALAAGDCDSFAIFTTDAQGDTNNQNHYDSKPEVFLNGGPTSAGGGLTAGTVIYYQVQEPDGDPLMEIRSTVIGADGMFRVQLFPFETTTNNGNEYKVVASTNADLAQGGGCTKSDNFKVDGPGALKITKDVEGGPANFTGNFDITVDCGASGTFDATIHFPDPGFVVIDGIDAKAECEVTEVDPPNAPDGFEWGDPTFTGNPATIESKKTVTVGITNHLSELPEPMGNLRITKDITGGPAGGTSGSFDITIDCGDAGTFTETVTFPDPGEVTIDDIAAGAECTVTEIIQEDPPLGFFWGPPSYVGNPATIVNGQTVTIEITNNLQPKPEPGLTVDKGVSLSADGPFTANLNTTVGTTVHYRITITNTGDVELTGVTLTDNTFNLAAEGCTIPTTLAVGAHFDCNYDAVATLGTTTNIATGDSDQTGPDTGTATVVATPANVPGLIIDKSNDAPISAIGLPTVAPGATVTYTLAYTVSNGPVANAEIVDILPDGVTYVNGSATSNGTFVFQGYNPGDRSLRWTAASVAANGSVMYMATVDADAASLPQPLENVATIDSDATDEDTDDSIVFVAPPPLAETAPPGETAPPTDIAGSGNDAQPSVSFPLLLGLLGLIVAAVLMVTPTPSSLKGRGRKD